MPPEKITSLQNPRLKQLVKLRDRRPRDEAGVFLIEGYREIFRALERKVVLHELYFSPDWFLGENESALLARAEAAGAKLFELPKEAFAKVAYRDRPDGLLAVAPQWRRSLEDLAGAGATPFLLVVEAIEKPGNLGTILRSADAAGCQAVIVCDPVTDLFNPNVVRGTGRWPGCASEKSASWRRRPRRRPFTAMPTCGGRWRSSWAASNTA